jgi:hypothetical protein
MLLLAALVWFRGSHADSAARALGARLAVGP